MKQKRWLLLASGIAFIATAVIYLILLLIVAPEINSTILPAVETQINDLVVAGELAVEDMSATMDYIKELIFTLVGALAVISVVDVLLGVLLIKRSKADDKTILNKKGLVITAMILSFFTAGLLIAILLIVELNTSVEVASIDNTFVGAKSETDEVQEINSKYEAKIRKLQALRDKGDITKEEYQTLLKKIFEE